MLSSRSALLLLYSRRRSSSLLRRCLATKRQQRAAAAAAQGKKELDKTPQNDNNSDSKPKRSSSLILPQTQFNDKQWKPVSLYDPKDAETTPLPIDTPHHPDLFDPSIHLPSLPTDWKDYESPTPLWHDICALIGVTGQPLSTAEYMRMCLTHPVHGYYTTAVSRTKEEEDDDFDHDDYADDTKNTNEDEIIGPAGDFVTAPEISQIFGECIGIWFMTQWQQQPQSAFQWLECGPGRGSLMIDLLRFCFHTEKIQNSFGKACQYVHFIEASPVLRQTQRTNLQAELQDKVALDFGDGKSQTSLGNNLPTVKVYWHDSLAAFQIWQKKSKSYLPTHVVCQEFLDALPVYSFEKTAEGWKERLVDVALREDMMDDEERERWKEATKGDTKKPRLRIVLAPQITPALQTLLRVDENGQLPNDEDPPADIGSVIEVNPEGILFCQDIAKLLDQQGGAALLIDYGQEGSTDSIRAFAKHEQVHFLSRPGDVDVTADVDFAAMKHAVNNLGLLSTQAFGPTTQGEFLMSMGAQDRVIQLIESENTTEQQAEDLYEALVRLASPEEMGERYKVLAIARTKEDVHGPPGF